LFTHLTSDMHFPFRGKRVWLDGFMVLANFPFLRFFFDGGRAYRAVAASGSQVVLRIKANLEPEPDPFKPPRQ
jgi:hypothetical protein